MAKLEVIVLGSGCSTGVPDVICLTNRGGCVACEDALRPGSPNKRLSTSLLVKYRPAPDVPFSNILIDSGKFLPETSVRWFREYDIKRIDAVVLTHTHFDAVGGLDALRAWTSLLQYTIPIYLREADMEAVRKVFFYLVEPQKHNTGSGIAALEFRTIGDAPFDVCGLEFTPLRVAHGKDYFANGYRFGDVCYVSDVSDFPPATLDLMRGCDLLFLDALLRERTFGNHLTLEQAIEVATALRPKRTFLVGMTHRLEHSATNAELAELKQNIQLARDGMHIKLA